MKQILIVPYRNRKDNLKIFIPAIKAYLPTCEIYVVEQYDKKPFNKGALINAGMHFVDGFGDYYGFHDVDTIPVKADYSYPQNPTHVSPYMEQFNYKMPSENYFGGCVLYTFDQYRSVNGFTNKINGWGCEDDLFYESFIEKGFKVDRREGTFTNLTHDRNHDNDQFAKNVAIWKQGRDFSEGLSTIKYTIAEYTIKNDYVHMKINLHLDE